jgi:hypothetical protein
MFWVAVMFTEISRKLFEKFLAYMHDLTKSFLWREWEILLFWIRLHKVGRITLGYNQRSAPKSNYALQHLKQDTRKEKKSDIGQFRDVQDGCRSEKRNPGQSPIDGLIETV